MKSLPQACANLFLFLVTFRRRVRHGIMPEVDEVRGQLKNIFDEQARAVSEDPRLEQAYQKIHYALVVLADEILINSNWSYAGAWEDELLEWDYFKTRIAGEEFFTKLEEEGEKDERLTEIYYIAMCLGFEGKYKGQPDKLIEMKRRLYRMLPGRFSDQEDRITPDAYFVGEGAKDVYRPMVNLGRIALVCVTLLAGLWVTNYFFTREVRAQIIRHVKEMKAEVPPTNLPPASVQDEASEEDAEEEETD